MSQLIDYVIWSLFHRSKETTHRPSHVLCCGFQKAPLQVHQQGPHRSTTPIPGVVSLHLNENVQKFKRGPWPEILRLLGSTGDTIIRHLLLDCGVFVRLEHGKENLHQTCGIPVCELLHERKVDAQRSRSTQNLEAAPGGRSPQTVRSPSTITFVRSRILYARPSVNAQGGIRFGVKHIHVFNRFPDLTDVMQLEHVMKYIFPRQSGLHNVFTSIVDKNETAQEFKDYTLREHEIKHAEYRRLNGRGPRIPPRSLRAPKRLRGVTSQMIQEMRKRHSKCSYTQLLRHHCPVRAVDTYATRLPFLADSQQHSGNIKTQLSSLRSTHSEPTEQDDFHESINVEQSILTYATQTTNVSSYCRAVIRRILPRHSLGIGADGDHNISLLLTNIDRFVRMRRHETLSLHEVQQNLKLNCIPWLCPPGVPVNAKVSQTDRDKRLELLLELLYYLFDSFLIPLIRSHFYVTESNVHRNHLFYFRHDVWRIVSQPSLTDLRFTMFSGLSGRDLRQARNSRLLGYSQVRLLPKDIGARPIINLRRKMTKNVNGKLVLSTNTNSRLMPVFAALNYERDQQPQRLGSSLFSIGEAHKRLRDFRDMVGGDQAKRLYFVKMDVTSCFDTIPQEQVIRMVQGLLSEYRYQIGKHAELKPVDGRWPTNNVDKPLMKFPHTARPSKSPPGLSELVLSQLAQKRIRTVFVDLWDSRNWDARSLLKLLQEHVQRNVIKIDKRFFRQSQGIPQGSVLSSLLCNFFYGAFESNCLDFLRPGESLLLRLIDDFLLITTNGGHAHRFAQIMVNGDSAYGISVNSKKSLANFEIAINGTKIPRLHGNQSFPYCGVAIDTNTLEISKFRENKDAEVSNGLSIDFSRNHGLRFRRKVLDSLKIQMIAMLLDTKLSNTRVVCSNLYQNFMEAAMKMYRYIRGLPKSKRPSEVMIVETWKDLVNLAVKMTRGKRSTKTIDEYECGISKTQMHWLASAALSHAMRKKQTGYRQVLLWVEDVMDKCQAGMRMTSTHLVALRDEGERVFEKFRY
jgi:telomerase reverse transcriptase